MSTRRIAGLRELADDFDVFLLDQYGVLHDGQTVFPGVIACLESLRAAGKTVAMISNSGKRAAENRMRLTRMGFGAELFDAVVTSGEVCHHMLQQRLASGALAEGARCLLLSRDRDHSTLQDLAITITAEADAADFLLIAGIESAPDGLAGYEARLAPLAARNVPCICANPDLRMYNDGKASPGPGALARSYAAMGGAVTWIGKPGPEIFDFALARLGDADRTRAIMVGDSPDHDIAGAKAAGLASLFVTSGLYASDELAAAEQPDFAMARLAW